VETVGHVDLSSTRRSSTAWSSGSGSGSGSVSAGYWHVKATGPAPAVLSWPTISVLELTATPFTWMILPPIGMPAICQGTRSAS
jgi:hypothetical protein